MIIVLGMDLQRNSSVNYIPLPLCQTLDWNQQKKYTDGILLFRMPLHDWELERVVEFFKILESFQGFKDTEDSLMWKPTSKGTGSVNSAYNILIRHKQSTN